MASFMLRCFNLFFVVDCMITIYQVFRDGWSDSSLRESQRMTMFPDQVVHNRTPQEQVNWYMHIEVVILIFLDVNHLDSH